MFFLGLQRDLLFLSDWEEKSKVRTSRVSHHSSVRKPLIENAALLCEVCVPCMCVCVYEHEVRANISLFLSPDWCGNWQGKSCIPFSQSSSFCTLSLRCRGGAETRVILQQAYTEPTQWSSNAVFHTNRCWAFSLYQFLELHMRNRCMMRYYLYG